ncbi:polysaccharide pyruvyl transferase family protein [Streptomyces sp. NPDC006430]|uniref:polysaccharide pyruvyl transferase family protein n=1 Tax=Streptomyces sp. NPDC006430 TaxID=3154299 RepID=UPI0033B3A4C1
MVEPVPAFWCRAPSQGNVGDGLTPWLVRRICGAPARWVAPHAPVLKHFVTGSVVSLAGPGAVVWGAGVMHAGEDIDPRAELIAVRGPLTREAALRSGAACSPVYGDPALLVPRFLPRRGRGTGRRPAVVPHFADKARAQLGTPAGWRLVDVQRPVEDVVEQLVRAPLIASSSLHGIILGHAYGIPAVWIRYQDLPSGDGSKFHDYFLSVGVPVPPPVPVGRTGAGLDSAELADYATLPARLPDLDLLLERCPFR